MSALFLLVPGAHRCAQLVFDVTSEGSEGVWDKQIVRMTVTGRPFCGALGSWASQAMSTDGQWALRWWLP